MTTGGFACLGAGYRAEKEDPQAYMYLVIAHDRCDRRRVKDEDLYALKARGFRIIREPRKKAWSYVEAYSVPNPRWLAQDAKESEELLR